MDDLNNVRGKSIAIARLRDNIVFDCAYFYPKIIVNEKMIFNEI